jgi:hypothetical protein
VRVCWLLGAVVCFVLWFQRAVRRVPLHAGMPGACHNGLAGFLRVLSQQHLLVGHGTGWLLLQRGVAGGAGYSSGADQQYLLLMLLASSAVGGVSCCCGGDGFSSGGGDVARMHRATAAWIRGR